MTSRPSSPPSRSPSIASAPRLAPSRLPQIAPVLSLSGWREWPPRRPEQPFFYPVLNEEYATKIARDWNVPHSGTGYVTRFKVRREFLDNYEVHQAGGQTILEYWIPAEDLAELNASIIGIIEIVARYDSTATD
jgi:hypothetical protein